MLRSSCAKCHERPTNTFDSLISTIARVLIYDPKQPALKSTRVTELLIYSAQKLGYGRVAGSDSDCPISKIDSYFSGHSYRPMTFKLL